MSNAPPIQRSDLENRFSYHPPFGDQPERYEKLRAAAKELAFLITELTPTSREQSLALTKLDEVVMHANSAIARHELDLGSSGQPSGARTG